MIEILKENSEIIELIVVFYAILPAIIVIGFTAISKKVQRIENLLLKQNEILLKTINKNEQKKED